MDKKAILIVGASGFIGRQIYLDLKKRNYPVIGTYCNNRGDFSKKDGVHLDLKNDDFRGLGDLNPLSHVVLCHGLSGFDACKSESSYSINVKNTCKLLDFIKKHDAGVIPVYISTSMVYRGNRRCSKETFATAPLNDYGKQKLEVENYIRKNFVKSIIFRLTKVIGTGIHDGTLFTSWADKLLRNKKIIAAKDYYISPIYVHDVVRTIRMLMNSGFYGIYNLGGDHVASYFDLANRLAAFLKFNSSLIVETTRERLGLEDKLPKFNSVDSGKITGIVPVRRVPLETCFKAVKANYGLNKQGG